MTLARRWRGKLPAISWRAAAWRSAAPTPGQADTQPGAGRVDPGTPARHGFLRRAKITLRRRYRRARRPIKPRQACQRHEEVEGRHRAADIVAARHPREVAEQTAQRRLH